MGDFWADQTSTDELHFPEDDVTIVFRKYLDSGIQEDIQNDAIKLQVADGQRGKKNGSGEMELREARVKAGELTLLHKMVLRIITKDHTYDPVPLSALRKLKPEVVRVLKRKYMENNPFSLLDSDLSDGLSDQELAATQTKDS